MSHIKKTDRLCDCILKKVFPEAWLDDATACQRVQPLPFTLNYINNLIKNCNEIIRSNLKERKVGKELAKDKSILNSFKRDPPTQTTKETIKQI